MPEDFLIRINWLIDRRRRQSIRRFCHSRLDIDVAANCSIGINQPSLSVKVGSVLTIDLNSFLFHPCFMKSNSIFCPIALGLFIVISPFVLKAQDSALQAQITAGQQVYNTVCFACHQPTGLGLPGMFPPVASSDWVSKPKPDRLIRMVLHGFMGPITLNGKPFTSPAPLMPPQGAALSDEQIANVLTYVRNSFGNKANAVSPAEVKAIREAEKARTAMWTEAEILKIPAE